MAEIASFAKPILVFSGGEPLLRADIYELASYAAQTGLRPALATNAALITREVASRLKECGVKLIAVSVYGSSAETHDGFCGMAGAFEKTLRGIRNIRKAGLALQINTTVTKQNLDELVMIGKLALREGARSYHPFFLVPTGRGKAMTGDEISPWEHEEAFERLYELELSIPLRIKVTCAPHYYRVLAQRRGQDDGSSSARKGCLAGQSVCFISYKGEVFGCGYLPVAAGDLRKKDFRTIWYESELFRDLRDDSILEGKCGVCEFRKLCGGCRARAYASTGDYLQEEPECVYQPIRLRSGLIVSDHSIRHE